MKEQWMVAPLTNQDVRDEAQPDESNVPCASAGPPPVPVFVLGLERSGTTWVANMLGGHSQGVCVEAPGHGSHSSLFFSYFARVYGDLEDDDNFRRFATDFAAS